MLFTTANDSDRKAAIEDLSLHKKDVSEVKNSLADGEYSGEKFAKTAQTMLGSRVEIAKRKELPSFKVLPKRWIVERSFAWLETDRRLWKNCERKLHTSLNMTVLAFVALLLNRF
jgi:transposase